MSSPYINTVLKTVINLPPNKFDNKVYLHLKEALRQKVEGKCFGHHGLIQEVFEITDTSNAIIQAEDLNANAQFELSFSCRICKPVSQTDIICVIHNISQVWISANNGPITFIITNDRINGDKFRIENNNARSYVDSTGKRKLLENGDYVKVTIIRDSFSPGDTKIIALGYLQDVATEEEILKYNNDLYSGDKVPDPETDDDLDVFSKKTETK